MPKKAKKTNSNCEQHLFLLKPKQNYCRFAQPISISFCDQLKDRNKTKAKKCKKISCLDCPIFNKDKNFATPTFILNSEKQYYEERGQRMRDEHEKKMIEYTDEKDSLNVPKPRTKNNFCSVCRQVYEDYLQHIQSQRHKKKINTSHFNRYILDIAEKFNPNSKNLFNYSHHTLSTGLQDDVEIIQRPKKRIKMDNNFNQRYQSYHNLIKPYIPPPPPHLDINHSGYFPRFSPQLNMSINQIQPIPFNQSLNQPYNLSYSMNFFVNPYGYNHFCPPTYSLFSPMMQYGQNPMPNNLLNPVMNPVMNNSLVSPIVNPIINPLQYHPRVQQPNYYLQESNHSNRSHVQEINNNFSDHKGDGINIHNTKQIKKQLSQKQKLQVIIIDDDEQNYNFQVRCLQNE